MKKIKVLVIEKSSIIAEGITHLLGKSASLEVIRTVNTLDRINEKIIVLKPDLILMNPSLIDFSKKMIFKSLFQDVAQIPIVALIYAFYEQQWLKHFNGIIEITDDLHKIESQLTEIYRNSTEHEESSETYELSDRETDVLIELSKGLMNKEIATKLNISIHTVITHRKNIIRKTGIKSVAGLTVYALLNNLIAESDISYR